MINFGKGARKISQDVVAKPGDGGSPRFIQRDPVISLSAHPLITMDELVQLLPKLSLPEDQSLCTVCQTITLKALEEYKDRIPHPRGARLVHRACRALGRITRLLGRFRILPAIQTGVCGQNF